MVWSIIKAVYGYVVDISDCYDENEEMVTIEKIKEKFKNISDKKLNIENYLSKNGKFYCELIHNFCCCSDSNNKYTIIGVIYDEIDRNLFLDEKFNTICDNVFNYPTFIKDINDDFFQHDSREYKSKNSKYGDPEYHSKIRSLPGERKNQLLNPHETIKNYVNLLEKEYPKLLSNPNCYLILDDCIFCS